MNEMLHCPSCGKDCPEGASFCPFCGALLPSRSVRGEGNSMTELIRARYDAYYTWADSVLAERNLGSVAMSWLTGNDAFKRSSEHERFLNDVTVLSEELQTRCASGESCSELPGLLRYVLIDCHADIPQETEWMFLAAEKLFMPFVECLSAADAAALYPDYKMLRRREPGLDAQKQILKMLKKQAQDS